MTAAAREAARQPGDDFVTEQCERDPDFRTAIDVAAAEVALGTALLARRKALGLSGPAVAEQSGCKRSTVYSAEQASHSTGLDTLLRLADALGCAITIEPGFGVRLTVVE